MNNGKADQEDNISKVLINLEGESIVAFTKFINQITTGQMNLNYLISKIDNT